MEGEMLALHCFTLQASWLSVSVCLARRWTNAAGFLEKGTAGMDGLLWERPASSQHLGVLDSFAFRSPGACMST
jgi:hypothetical protein